VAANEVDGNIYFEDGVFFTAHQDDTVYHKGTDEYVWLGISPAADIMLNAGFISV